MSQCTEGFHCGGKLDLETGEGLRKVGGGEERRGWKIFLSWI